MSGAGPMHRVLSGALDRLVSAFHLLVFVRPPRLEVVSAVSQRLLRNKDATFVAGQKTCYSTDCNDSSSVLDPGSSCKGALQTLAAGTNKRKNSVTTEALFSRCPHFLCIKDPSGEYLFCSYVHLSPVHQRLPSLDNHSVVKHFSSPQALPPPDSPSRADVTGRSLVGCPQPTRHRRP